MPNSSGPIAKQQANGFSRQVSVNARSFERALDLAMRSAQDAFDTKRVMLKFKSVHYDHTIPDYIESKLVYRFEVTDAPE